MRKRVFLIAAARPNFMKVAPLYRSLSAPECPLEPVLIHTGQHYDKNMSDIFFSDLEMPAPAHHLGVGGGSHAEQAAGVMVRFEQLVLADRPDIVVVVGDVNATAAVTMTATKLGVPVAHVEAGLRSCDRTMPEELNRLVTDVLADLLFTPSPDADENLRAEGIAPAKVYLVGNIMIDSLVRSLARARGLGSFAKLGLADGQYGVVTLHRPANVDEPANLEALLRVISGCGIPLVFPVHPRTRAVMQKHDLVARLRLADKPIVLTDPLGYYEFMNLVSHSRLIITDSGGLQEETTFLGIPCLTMRPNTERPVTITMGTNELATIDSLPEQLTTIRDGRWKQGAIPPLWDGNTASRIRRVLEHYLR